MVNNRPETPKLLENQYLSSKFVLHLFQTSAGAPTYKYQDPLDEKHKFNLPNTSFSLPSKGLSGRESKHLEASFKTSVHRI